MISNNTISTRIYMNYKVKFKAKTTYLNISKYLIKQKKKFNNNNISFVLRNSFSLFTGILFFFVVVVALKEIHMR